MSVRDPEVLDVEAGVPGVPGGPEQSRRPVVAGLAAGLWSLLVGVALVTCLVMLAWAVSPNSAGDSAAAWRAAGSVWLGAHQVPLDIGDRTLTLLPLGAVLLGLLLTRRAGRWAGRLLAGTTPREAGAIVASCALVYGAGGAGVAWLASGPGTSASPVAAFLRTAVVAMVGVAWGIAREAGLVALARARVSDAAWRTVMGGLAAVVGIFAVGGLLVSVSLVRHFGQIADTLAGLDAGPAGALALTVLGMLCLPTLDIWAMAVVVGPGVDLGSAGALNAFGGQVGALPALPVLAAIPTTVPGWGPLLMLVPGALGVLAGRIRWGRDLPTLTGTAASAVGLAGVVAALMGGLVMLAAGSLGGGRLADVGPQVLPVAAAASGLVVLGFLAEAAFQSLRLSWELHQAERRAEERRLRLAARGVADPAEAADVETGDPAFEVVEGVDAEQAQERSPEESARRLPRPIRQSIAIPVVVAGAEPDAAPGDEGTSTDMVEDDDGNQRGEARGDDAEAGGEQPVDLEDDPDVPIDAEDGATEHIETGGSEDADPEPDVTVDLTVDQQAGANQIQADLAIVGDTQPEGDMEVSDGDSTVDLTIDPADLAEIRAARRDHATGEGTA